MVAVQYSKKFACLQMPTEQQRNFSASSDWRTYSSQEQSAHSFRASQELQLTVNDEPWNCSDLFQMWWWCTDLTDIIFRGRTTVNLVTLLEFNWQIILSLSLSLKYIIFSTILHPVHQFITKFSHILRKLHVDMEKQDKLLFQGKK